MGRRKQGNATLRIAGRGEWQMKLLKKEDGFYLDDGWERFYQENYLEVTNLLSFKYIGKLKFTVEVFDDTGIKIC